MSADTQVRFLNSLLVIWTGQACSLVGSELVQFSLVWWLARSTGSAIVLAFATVMAPFPQILLGPMAGLKQSEAGARH